MDEVNPSDPKVAAYFNRVAADRAPMCTCTCDATFRSHCYIDFTTGAKYSQHGCPGCGSHTNVYRISHDPEIWGVKG